MTAGMIIAQRRPMRSDTIPQLELARNTSRFASIIGVAISAVESPRSFCRWVVKHSSVQDGSICGALTAKSKRAPRGCPLHFMAKLGSPCLGSALGRYETAPMWKGPPSARGGDGRLHQLDQFSGALSASAQGQQGHP